MTTTTGKTRTKRAGTAAAPAVAAAPSDEKHEMPDPAALNEVPADEPAEPPVQVALDLDTLDKFDIIDDAVEEMFTFRLKGKVFEMRDPRDINWQDIFQSIRNPAMFMRYAMPTEQQDVFYALSMPAWQLGVLLQRWHKHYNMADPADLTKLITG